ncbi:hypothetical protein [Crateriforma conspicua]|uniref:Uncharacterized protein n=1 Tax=Crateriforma conspicua TaxID=2527996 RepID=A0A5C6FP67_9PLAN|nr:hypothetical protein [Crateriforma conspicua]TWU62296.1 hypothetical protein V7x_40250 [Crateriforma conspicua]
MRAIPTLLRLLDCDWPSEPRVTRSDIWSIGRDEPDIYETTGILVPAVPATKVDGTCDFCSSHEVARDGVGEEAQFYEVCPYGEGGPIDPSELRTWAIDPAGIAGVLAASVGGDITTLLPGKAWQIGDVAIGEESFAIILALRSAGSSLAERSAAKRMLAIGFNSLPVDAFAGVVAPDAAFRFGDSVEFRRHRIEQALPRSEVRTGNAFYRKGQMWVVRYQGEETFLENNVGPLYIARLLASPNRAVPAVTLLASRIGIDERKLTGSSGELADESAVEQCRQRYADLMHELEDAEANNDTARMDHLQAEQDELTSHLASVLGKGGRRRESNDAEKVRKSVSNAIRRTLDVLDNELPAAGKHLRSSLTLGACPVYGTDESMNWIV